MDNISEIPNTEVDIGTGDITVQFGNLNLECGLANNGINLGVSGWVYPRTDHPVCWSGSACDKWWGAGLCHSWSPPRGMMVFWEIVKE